MADSTAHRYSGAVWWSDDEWARLHAPDTCGMCADAHVKENEHSVLIASTATTHVRLARNQAHAGYCVVVLRNHVTDLVLLSPEHLSAFWADVQRAGRAIEATFSPKKVDYLVMGHRMPHLHCHVLPQHATDDPTRNVDISDGPRFLSTDALHSALMRVRAAWDAQVV